MSNSPASSRRIAGPAVVILVLAVALVAVITVGSSVLRQSATSSLRDVLPGADVPGDTAGSGTDGTVTEADGVVPDGATVFDDQYPGVTNLDPQLLHAIRAAATDAAEDGVTFMVNSGWRSPDYQRQLFREAVQKYGSEAEASRWAATADTSAHVSGNAIDIGATDATVWLSEHGRAHGLCQTYVNEPWHYELRPEAVDKRCPRMYVDASQDPRMQR